MKATYLTDQTNVPDTLPQRHRLGSLLGCMRVYTDKAAALLFSVKGNQCRAVGLKHNSVSVHVVSACVFVCVCVWLPFLPAVTQ